MPSASRMATVPLWPERTHVPKNPAAENSGSRIRTMVRSPKGDELWLLCEDRDLDLEAEDEAALCEKC